MHCKRKFHFDAAHRVMGHGGKCLRLHGHRYALTVTVTSGDLDELGMVIDFAVLKELIGSWIRENLDHNTILYEKDLELGTQISRITGQKVYYMNQNPTAENIAQHLLDDILPELLKNEQVRIVSVALEETENCSVIVNYKWMRQHPSANEAPTE